MHSPIPDSRCQGSSTGRCTAGGISYKVTRESEGLYDLLASLSLVPECSALDLYETDGTYRIQTETVIRYCYEALDKIADVYPCHGEWRMRNDSLTVVLEHYMCQLKKKVSEAMPREKG